MELDVWIPLEGIGVEYQGEQHYHGDCNIFGRYSKNLLSDGPPVISADSEDGWVKDTAKRRACETNGIWLVTVPYWWDQQEDSLVGLLRDSGLNVKEPAV